MRKMLENFLEMQFKLIKVNLGFSQACHYHYWLEEVYME